MPAPPASVRSAAAPLAALALLVLALAACAAPPARPTYPEITWAHLPPFELDVAAVEVVSEYEPPYKEPNVEHLFPVPPGEAARRWADDRIRAAGTEGRAKVVIKRASVTETPLELTEGVRTSPFARTSVKIRLDRPKTGSASHPSSDGCSLTGM